VGQRRGKSRPRIGPGPAAPELETRERNIKGSAMLDDRTAEARNEQGIQVGLDGGGGANAGAKASLIKGGPKADPASIFGERQALWQGDTLDFLTRLPVGPIFDLVVTSPPYNIGKSYEVRKKLDAY